MKKKKLLFAGGGYADIPLILAAKQLGYYVITSGNRPDELGHGYSDEYHAADFSDKNAILDLAKELSVDAICPCCNDFSAISCTYVAEKLRLPGHDPYDTSLILHHKDRYRKFVLENGIPTPLARGFSNPEEAVAAVEEFRFPVIIKPVDLTGGKGISTVHDTASFNRSIEKAFAISKSNRIVVEEFLEGSRHGFSAFIRDGKVVFHFSDDEYYFHNQYLVSAASTPTTAPSRAIDELVEQSEKIAKLLKLATGIFHVQFIMHEERPVIIEICRRPPGDLYVKLVEHATGINYAEWIVRGFCGEPCDDLTQHDVSGYFLRHCIMADSEGVVCNISYDPDMQSRIIDRLMLWNAGDVVEDHLVSKFGIVFLEFSSKHELVRKAHQMQRLIRVDIR